MSICIEQRTNKVVYSDLSKIAKLHAEEIKYKQSFAHKLLFIDSDINTTKSYSRYLFKKELKVAKEIEAINK